MIIGFSRFCVTVFFVGMGFDCQRDEKSRSTDIEGGLLNILDDIVDMGLATSFDDVGRKRALVTKRRPKVEGAD